RGRDGFRELLARGDRAAARQRDRLRAGTAAGNRERPGERAEHARVEVGRKGLPAEEEEAGLDSLRPAVVQPRPDREPAAREGALVQVLVAEQQGRARVAEEADLDRAGGRVDERSRGQERRDVVVLEPPEQVLGPHPDAAVGAAGRAAALAAAGGAAVR